QAPAKQPAPNAASKPQPAAQQQQEQGREFSLQDLKITDGQVALTDLQKRQPRAVYDHIDLRLIGYDRDKPFQLSAAAHLPGAGAELAKIEGTAGPIDQKDPANSPFKGKINLDEVSLGGLKKFLNSQALANMDAVASGKANVNSSGGKLQSDG